MRILAQAKKLEAQGRSIIHMEIGEPDFPSPESVIAAGKLALEGKLTHYTAANGLLELRQCIAKQYHLKPSLNADRILVTPGSSGALQLAMALLLNSGDGIMLTDPGYPCNRHIASLFNADIQAIAVDESSDYQLTAELISENWKDNTKVVLLTSPSNPTGTLISNEQLTAITHRLEEKGAVLVVDEIYHGLVYENEIDSALNLSDQLFVVNSFSKYYGMTGWRVGWLVVPEDFIDAAIKLAQNMFLAAPTISQYAAIAALGEKSEKELQRRREIFLQRRDMLLPLIEEAGFKVKSKPTGAFYVYADCSGISDNSMELCDQLLNQAGVAITPGADFGTNGSDTHVRFSYANTKENLQEGMRRIQEWISNAA